MNKLAIFVEGYTELIFAEKLVREIAGDNNVFIEKKFVTGGVNSRRRVKQIQATNKHNNERYYVLIMDCQGDRQVKTRIIEEHKNLTNNGYSGIIGIRDVRPDFSFADIPKLELQLLTYIKTSLIPVEFILGVMEIEAWFLAEASHFPRIATAITVPAIITALGFDPQKEDMQQRPYPSQDLARCYAIGGVTYHKRNAQQTVDALDFSIIYCDFQLNFPTLRG
jgi:hypothetical protein